MAAVNLLALDKSVLKFLKAPEGHKRGYLDFSSLEPTLLAHFSQDPTYMKPTLLAHFSQDPTYMKIYGPGANPNHCIYSYVGVLSDMYPEFKDHYNLDNPTKEGVSYIKNNLSENRQVCKVGHLMLMYGGGAGRLFQQYQLAGVNLNFAETKAFYNKYWRAFSKVKQYESYLLSEWYSNGGYIITGRGIPHPIDREYTKDILNRMIQTTGHHYLQRFLYHITCIKKERKIPMKPWFVDHHDATCWAAPEECIPEANQVLMDALERLNKELNLSVTLKGVVKNSYNYTVAS